MTRGNGKGPHPRTTRTRHPWHTRSCSPRGEALARPRIEAPTIAARDTVVVTNPPWDLSKQGGRSADRRRSARTTRGPAALSSLADVEESRCGTTRTTGPSIGPGSRRSLRVTKPSLKQAAAPARSAPESSRLWEPGRQREGITEREARRWNGGIAIP